jgi:hypothetical protein
MSEEKVVTSESIKAAGDNEKKENKTVKKTPAKKPAAKKTSPEKSDSGEILIKMIQGRSYSIYEYDFTLDHPYKRIPEGIALNLLATGSFERGKDEDLKVFYGEN